MYSSKSYAEGGRGEAALKVATLRPLYGKEHDGVYAKVPAQRAGLQGVYLREVFINVVS